jgi:hypothetical protein
MAHLIYVLWQVFEGEPAFATRYALRAFADRRSSVSAAMKPVRAALVCHPSTPTALVRSIDAIVHRAKAGAIELSYVLKAELTALHIPFSQPQRRSDRLWEHTCFEAFVMLNDGPVYVEFNMAPSGEWAAYQFTGYRERASIQPDMRAPSIKVKHARGRLELDATIRQSDMISMRPGARLRLGLSAVLEDASGALSYWALQHPGVKPDFHHIDGFALQLSIPG